MGPEFYLEVTNFLNGFRHLSLKSFKFNDVSEFRIDVLVLLVVILDILLNNVLVPKDGELLLK